LQQKKIEDDEKLILKSIKNQKKSTS